MSNNLSLFLIFNDDKLPLCHYPGSRYLLDHTLTLWADSLIRPNNWDRHKASDLNTSYKEDQNLIFNWKKLFQ